MPEKRNVQLDSVLSTIRLAGNAGKQITRRGYWMFRNGDRIRLETVIEPRVKYVASNHCWRGSEAYATQTMYYDIKDRRQEFKLSEPPDTLADSMRVMLFLQK